MIGQEMKEDLVLKFRISFLALVSYLDSYINSFHKFLFSLNIYIILYHIISNGQSVKIKWNRCQSVGGEADVKKLALAIGKGDLVLKGWVGEGRGERPMSRSYNN